MDFSFFTIPTASTQVAFSLGFVTVTAAQWGQTGKTLHNTTMKTAESGRRSTHTRAIMTQPLVQAVVV
jgi:hypothetical protein